MKRKKGKHARNRVRNNDRNSCVIGISFFIQLLFALLNRSRRKYLEIQQFLLMNYYLHGFE